MLTFLAAFLGSLLGSFIYAHFFKRDKMPEIKAPEMPRLTMQKKDKTPVSIDNERLKRWWYGEEEGEA